MEEVLEKMNLMYKDIMDIVSRPKERMMNLADFEAAYGVPIDTVRDWIDDEKGFAGKVAYKLGRRWYIDTRAFERWRYFKHRESYKYA